MRQSLKRKIIEESDSIDCIVEQAYHNINIKFNDLVINLSSIRALKNNLQKQRRKIRPPVPQNFLHNSQMLIVKQNKTNGFCYMMGY